MCLNLHINVSVNWDLDCLYQYLVVGRFDQKVKFLLKLGKLLKRTGKAVWCCFDLFTSSLNITRKNCTKTSPNASKNVVKASADRFQRFAGEHLQWSYIYNKVAGPDHQIYEKYDSICRSFPQRRPLFVNLRNQFVDVFVRAHSFSTYAKFS